MTNAHEGDIFLTGIGDVSLQQYQRQLFPSLNADQLFKSAALYANVSGTVFDQESASYGESESPCLFLIQRRSRLA